MSLPEIIREILRAHSCRDEVPKKDLAIRPITRWDPCDRQRYISQLIDALNRWTSSLVVCILISGRHVAAIEFAALL